MHRKRARTDSSANWISRPEGQDVAMDGEGIDSASLADNELPVRSRKVPDSSRTAETVPRENRLGSTASQTAGAPSQRARRDMQIPDELNLDDEAVEKLQHAMQHPPVTVKTLYELELVCILGNVNLRVDVNFDHDLHFMPVKGRRGDEKKEQAQTYWTALALELQIYIFTARQSTSTTRPRPKVFWQRLPQMFEDLKELLLTLIPDVEADGINQTLDVPLLMQQVEKGVLDIGRLARWLANLLKNHCAPMRDAWADEMVKLVEEGLSMHDTTRIVEGLEKLFGILEAMKLDVANHQIRTFRLYLIEDTIKFQQSHFRKKMAEGKLDLSASRRWHEEAQQQHYTCNESTTQDDRLLRFASVVHGVISELTAMEGSYKFPTVFHYERSRLQQQRAEIQNQIHHDLCCAMLKTCLGSVANGQNPSTFVPVISAFSSRLFDLLGADLRSPDHVDNVEEVWHSNIDLIAVEIVRAVYVSRGQNVNSISPAEVDSVKETLLRLFRGQYAECQRIVTKVHEDLERSTVAHAQRFHAMSPYQIAESQKQERLQKQKQSGQRPPDLEDVARKIAHIAVLNWNVFAGMVYNPEDRRISSEQRSTVLTASSIATQQQGARGTSSRARQESGAFGMETGHSQI